MQKRNTVIPCEIYSRVVGYFRPVDQWNAGKKEEFRLRKTQHVPELQNNYSENFNARSKKNS